MFSNQLARGVIEVAATVSVVGLLTVGCSTMPGTSPTEEELAEYWVSEDYPQVFLRFETDSGEQTYDLSPCPMLGNWTQEGDVISLQITSVLDIIISECPEKFDESARKITVMKLLPDDKAELINEETGEKFLFKETTEEEWSKSNKLP